MAVISLMKQKKQEIKKTKLGTVWSFMVWFGL